MGLLEVLSNYQDSAWGIQHPHIYVVDELLNSKFNFVQNMFTPMMYLYMYNAVDHNKSFLFQQSLIISTLLSSFTLQTQQHLLKISQGTNVALLPRQNNYLMNNNHSS